jgi:hypothetical protein
MWRLVVERYVTYPAILDCKYEDVMKLNAIIDFREHCENEEKVMHERNQARNLK